MTTPSSFQPRKHSSTHVTPHDAPVTAAQPQAADDLLDEIDSLLESNAAEFVASYVQKGGQ